MCGVSAVDVDEMIGPEDGAQDFEAGAIGLHEARPSMGWCVCYCNCYVSARSTRLGVAGILHSSAGKWRTHDTSYASTNHDARWCRTRDVFLALVQTMIKISQIGLVGVSSIRYAET